MRTTTLMRAIVYRHGASADVLKLEEIDKPLPGERRFRAEAGLHPACDLQYRWLCHTNELPVHTRL